MAHTIRSIVGIDIEGQEPAPVRLCTYMFNGNHRYLYVSVERARVKLEDGQDDTIYVQDEEEHAIEGTCDECLFFYLVGCGKLPAEAKFDDSELAKTARLSFARLESPASH